MRLLLTTRAELTDSPFFHIPSSTAGNAGNERRSGRTALPHASRAHVIRWEIADGGAVTGQLSLVTKEATFERKPFTLKLVKGDRPWDWLVDEVKMD